MQFKFFDTARRVNIGRAKWWTLRFRSPCFTRGKYDLTQLRVATGLRFSIEVAWPTMARILNHSLIATFRRLVHRNYANRYRFLNNYTFRYVITNVTRRGYFAYFIIVLIHEGLKIRIEDFRKIRTQMRIFVSCREFIEMKETV